MLFQGLESLSSNPGSANPLILNVNQDSVSIVLLAELWG